METFGQWLSRKFPGTTTHVWTPRYLDAEFPSNTKSQKAAWDLHVELRTRIAIEALPLHSGREAAALESLHSLFQTTRATLREGGPELGALGAVVMKVINEDLRPVTAYWHGVVGDGSFEDPDEAGDFRADLLNTQNSLRQLADFLGYVARGETYAADQLLKEPIKPVTRYSPGPLPAATIASALDELQAKELKTIKVRRLYVGLPPLSSVGQAAGVALSGGGIRSATFGLGVLTALSRAGLYHQFDYLSTVSGGGYTGTLVSTWATAKAAEGDADKTVEEAVRRALTDGPFCNDAAVEHLRDRSRYLTEGGILGTARAALPISLGIIASLATLLLTTLITLPLVWAGGEAFSWLSRNCGAALAGVAVLVAFAAVGMRIPNVRPTIAGWGAALLVGLTALAAPAAAVAIVAALRDTLESAIGAVTPQVAADAVLAALPFVVTGIGTLLQRRKTMLRLAPVLLALSPWVAYALVLTVLAHHVPWGAWRPGDGSGTCTCTWLWGWLVAQAVAALLFVFSDVNANSPLGYYRDRLAATYCVRTQGEQVLPNERPPALKDLTQKAPIHLINATVNMPASRARNGRGRGAAALAFSRHGWSYPAERQGRIEHQYASGPSTSIDAGLAMAISGAAVSPWMGTLTPAGASPWLTLFNLRLSAWLPNPNHGPSPPWGFYLLREFLGRVGLKRRRLNVSDGGHFENLGVYELVRRRCRYIVAIDGEADPELRCGGLMNLIRLARIDFGADIRIDVRKLKPNKSRFSYAHITVGRISYLGGGSGILLYVKLSVTGDEPAHLLAYRAREPVFPHHSTTDQIFSEEQFECYRALGQHVGEHLFRAELVGELASKAQQHSKDHSAPIDLGEWLGEVEKSLNRERPS